jgi:iron complex transport system substrate-binding protein
MLRYRLAPIFALLVALALVACGGSDDSESDSGSSSGQSSGSYPVTIEHKFGSTTIEEQPKRIVTVGYTEQDIVLALGMKPVGEREFLGGYDYKNRPWAQEALGGTQPEPVGQEQTNFERVAALRPDILLGVNSGMSSRDYKTLSKIAPTVAQTDEFIDFGVPWQEQTRMIGEALGVEDKAKQVTEEAEAKMAAVAKEHPDWKGKTAALAYGSGGGKFGAYSSQDYRTRFFEDLGFETPKSIDKIAGDSFYVDFSKEQVRLIDQDVIVMFASEKDVASDPLYKRLDAVKEGRVIYLDLEDQLSGALGFGSPLSLPYAAENFATPLDQAIDGDPSTKVDQPTPEP